MRTQADAERELGQMRMEVEKLKRRLADCVVWMDTREKMVPGMPRICDTARAALNPRQEAD